MSSQYLTVFARFFTGDSVEVVSRSMHVRLFMKVNKYNNSQRLDRVDFLQGILWRFWWRNSPIKLPQ